MSQPAHFANDDASFYAGVHDIERRSNGLLCFAARDMQTGDILRYNADHKCRTASVIKLPILIHLGLCIYEGSLKWEQKLTLTEDEKVEGSGALTNLAQGLALTLRDTATLMIILSDNTATNMILELVGLESINHRMRSLGLPVTTIFRKVFSLNGPANTYGLGVTTPNEALSLLLMLVEGGIGDEKLSADLVSILAEQQYRDSIPRYLPSDWVYAGKTGAINEARNDVGIVTDEHGNRYLLSLFAQDLKELLWTADNPGTLALARLAQHILQNK